LLGYLRPDTTWKIIHVFWRELIEWRQFIPEFEFITVWHGEGWKRNGVMQGLVGKLGGKTPL
jgi:hypothetical protein